MATFRYISPIEIAATTTLNVIAVDTMGTVSDMQTEVYMFPPRSVYFDGVPYVSGEQVFYRTADFYVDGAAVAETTAQGLLSRPLDLAGGSVGKTTSASAMQRPVALHGAVTGQTVTSAALTGNIPLRGTASASAANTAIVAGVIALEGNSTAATYCSSSIIDQVTPVIKFVDTPRLENGRIYYTTADFTLEGMLVAESSVAATLLSAVRLSGIAQGTLSATAALTTKTSLKGASQGVCSALAQLSEQGSLLIHGTTTGKTIATADMMTVMDLAGSAMGTAKVSGWYGHYVDTIPASLSFDTISRNIGFAVTNNNVVFAATDRNITFTATRTGGV
jgi:hypothetical protein